MDAMQMMSSFTGITDMQSLQSIQNNSGVTGSTGGFFNEFVQSLLSGFSGTDEEVANLLAGLGVFSDTEEKPEDNAELMSVIASMMSMGVNINDVMKDGSFDPTSYINSALTGTDYSNYFGTDTYSDLMTLSTNTGTDMSTLMGIATGNDYSDGQLMLELAMSSANTNLLNSDFGTTLGSTNDFDISSYFGTGMYSDSNSDLATQLYSANSNMSSAIAQALATTQDSTVAQVTEEPTEPENFDDISGLSQFIPTSVDTTFEVESAEEVFQMQELDVEDLNTQIETGIKNGDITDTKEMVIKLRPEGLGEVTVKLVQDSESNIKIDIVTASEATAKLLNEKLPQLRDSMRDLQAEISEVFYNDNEGNFEQNAKDQAAQWAYNQDQRDQRQAFNLDDLEDLVDDMVDDDVAIDSKIYI